MRNLVVMPNYRKSASDPMFVKNCRHAWEMWCKDNDCTFLELNEPIADFDSVPPQMQKMWTLDILLHNHIEFNQVAQVDYDTFPLPHCGNFFNRVNNKFGAVLDNGFGPSLNRSSKMVQKNWYSDIVVNWDNYFNSGFIVYNKIHKPVFEAIQSFYIEKQSEWCKANKSPNFTDDQTILNFELRKQGFEVVLLDRSYNVLDWHCRNFFANYIDDLSREINAVSNITDCVNIFHLTGDENFRNTASDFLMTNFYNNVR